jgi:hypothetical protein
MKDLSVREQFLLLRSQGLSYSVIASRLNISKKTCVSWGKEYAEDISRMKQERLNALYETYSMSKEARIRKLGEALSKIDSALENADLESVPPEKLLDFKLKYTEALKSEYLGYSPRTELPELPTAEDVLRAHADLINRLQSGELPPEQASREATILLNLMKSIQGEDLEERIKELESVLSSR